MLQVIQFHAADPTKRCPRVGASELLIYINCLRLLFEGPELSMNILHESNKLLGVI